MSNLSEISSKFNIDEKLLEKFKLGKYRFSLQLLQDAWLSEYKGAMLRSAIGNLFKKICCAKKLDAKCTDCQYRASCAYGYIYHTQLPKDSQYLKSIRNIPRPYIIEPPLDFRRKMPAGEKFEFNLILIGKAIEFFPYFFTLFKWLGDPKEKSVGLGSRRSKFRITRVTSIDVHNKDWNTLYTPGEEPQLEFVETDQISLADILQANSENPISQKVHLELLTPMDIRTRHKLVKPLEPRYLIRSLLYFSSALSYFHCQSEPLIEDQEAKKLVQDSADQVRISRDNTHVRTFYRKRQKIIGLMGDITYEGNLDPFSPFLYLGEWIHTGKGRVMGLGQYKLVRGVENGCAL